MRNVYVVADNIYSPLGRDTKSNIEALKLGKSGIQLQVSNLSPDPFYASLFDAANKIDDKSKTFFEQVVLASATDAIQKTNTYSTVLTGANGWISLCARNRTLNV